MSNDYVSYAIYIFCHSILSVLSLDSMLTEALFHTTIENGSCDSKLQKSVSWARDQRDYSWFFHRISNLRWFLGLTSSLPVEGHGTFMQNRYSENG